MKPDREKILTLLAKVCGEGNKDAILSLDSGSKLANVGFDSLKFIQFIVKVEEEFDFEILDSDLLFEKFQTPNKIFETLGKYFDTPKPLKKCLILDCDNVLWCGVAGEEPLIFDEDVKGFHALVRNLYSRGILLCLCSKNEPEFIKQAFSASEMTLKFEDFALTKINRRSKAANILEIADELNLSPDSFVFADDSDYELGYVAAALPQVLTVKVDYSEPTFPENIRAAFAETPASELNRTKLFRDQKEREKEKSRFVSVDEYNASLETSVVCRMADYTEIPRLAELSRRTNQFNLSDSHYSEDELKALLDDNNIKVFSLSVQDKYGDMGIVGMAILRGKTIEAFMLSCRVFDRGFEYILLDKLKTQTPSPLRGIFTPNGKNTRFEKFFEDNGVIII